MFTYTSKTAALKDKYLDACYKGNINTVKDLITNEPKSLKTNEFLLHCIKKACKGGHLDIFNVVNNHKHFMTLYNNALYDVFYNACKGGNFDIIKQIVETMEHQYINKNLEDEDEDTLINIHNFFRYGLSGACKRGNLEVCILCMSFLHTVETADGLHILLFQACNSGNINVVNLIIEYGNKFHVEWDWNEALEIACADGSIKVAKLLVKYGADNFNTCLMEACMFGQSKTIKYMIDCGGTVLKSHMYYVCATGDLSLVKYYLSKLSVEMFDLKEGLEGACKGGNIKIVKLLLKRGGQQERKNKRIYGNNSEKFNVNWDMCMFEACSNNHMVIVNFIVNFMIDEPIVNFRKSIIEAKMCSNIDIVNFLLSRYDVDLYTACICGNLPLVEMCLKVESIENEDELDESLKAACSHNHHDIAKLLLAHGAGSKPIVINECMIMACHAGNYDTVVLMLSHGATNMDDCFKINYHHDKNVDIYNVLIAAGATELTLLEYVDDLKLYCLYCEYKGIKLNRERYRELIHKEPACVLFSGSKLTRNSVSGVSNDGDGNGGNKRKCSVKRLPHDLFNMMILY